MRFPRSALPLLALLLPVLAGATSAPAQPDIPFESYRLANGLEVILFEDRRLPLTAVNLRFRVGAGNDPPGRLGLAHLFEHLMLGRTRHYADPVSVLQGAGATQVGETTDLDRTTYYRTIPSGALELLFAIESDRLRYFLDTIDEKQLSRERANVRNERRLVVENEPYGLGDEALFRNLFPRGHPYYGRYIGTHADVEAVRLDEATAFFKRYYSMSNASIAIAGDIDKARTRELIEKYFGSIPAGAAVPLREVAVTPITAERRVTVTDRVDLPRVTVGWLTPSIREAQSANADLLAIILGSGPSSRLQEHLVREQRVAQEISVEHLPYARASAFVIRATAIKGVKLEDLENALETELEALRSKGPTQQEVERARNTVELRIMRGLEKLGDITAIGDSTLDGWYGGVAEQLSECSHFFGSPACIPGKFQRYRSATPAALRNLARTALATKARVIVHTVPGEKQVDDPPGRSVEGEAAEDEVPGDSAMFAAVLPAVALPSVVAASHIDLPLPQRFVLPNGLTLLLMEQHRLPIVAINVVVRGGSATSPRDRSGLAAFTLKMLLHGTVRRSALQIGRDAAQLGSSVDSDISSDAAALSMRVLRGNLGPAFDLLSDVVRRPAFAEREINRLRADKIALLAQQQSNNDTRASQLFSEMLYGSPHPYWNSGLFNDELFSRRHRYGYDEVGTPESLAAIARDDLTSFWKKTYAPDSTALIVAGDVSPAELRALATKYFGDWSAKAAPLPQLPTVQSSARRIVIADAGESSQTALRIGTLGLSRASPDYVAARMLNIVFGEIYSSRITQNLRGRNGYTYMARSQFAFRREPGPFVLGTNVRTDATAPAIREIFSEIRRIRTEPVTNAELAFARNAFNGSLVGLFETTGSAATSQGQIFTYGLPLDYYATLQRRIVSIAASDIESAAVRYLDPDKMLVVAVGDRSKIEPALRPLNLGEMVSPDGSASQTIELPRK